MSARPAGDGAVRRAWWLMVVVTGVFLVPPAAYTLVGSPDGNQEPANPLPVLALAGAVAAIHLWHAARVAAGTRPRGWPVALVALAVLGYAPMAWWGWNWFTMQWFLAASLMLLPTRVPAVMVPLAVAVTAGPAVIAGVDNALRYGVLTGAIAALYDLIGMVVGALSLYGSVRLVRVLAELHAARVGLADAAVGQERLRVSRELHDLLGQSLSAVSLKGDLALALLPHDPAAARAEVAGLTEVARTALRDVRAVARAEHTVTLATELDGAAGLLAAAGIDATVTPAATPRTRAAERLLAWAVREGVTNVLRHSEARTCTISTDRDGGAIRLTVVNDGTYRPTGWGSGVAGLAERAGALSGTATTSRDGDRFRLVVEVPDLEEGRQAP